MKISPVAALRFATSAQAAVSGARLVAEGTGAARSLGPARSEANSTHHMIAFEPGPAANIATARTTATDVPPNAL